MNGLPRWLPQDDTVPTPGSGVSNLPPLYLTFEQPPGYPPPPPGTVHPVFVTWGRAGNRPPSNITAYSPAATGKRFAIKVTTNGAHPIQVLSAEIVAAVGEVPADTGGTEFTPPTVMYRLLGEILGAGTEASPFAIGQGPGGNLNLESYLLGTVCQTYAPGNPSAEPPVPATPAGVRSTYGVRWVVGG